LLPSDANGPGRRRIVVRRGFRPNYFLLLCVRAWWLHWSSCCSVKETRAGRHDGACLDASIVLGECRNGVYEFSLAQYINPAGDLCQPETTPVNVNDDATTPIRHIYQPQTLLYRTLCFYCILPAHPSSQRSMRRRGATTGRAILRTLRGFEPCCSLPVAHLKIPLPNSGTAALRMRTTHSTSKQGEASLSFPKQYGLMMYAGSCYLRHGLHLAPRFSSPQSEIFCRYCYPWLAGIYRSAIFRLLAISLFRPPQRSDRQYPVILEQVTGQV
jgi:hypothetical protein